MRQIAITRLISTALSGAVSEGPPPPQWSLEKGGGGGGDSAGSFSLRAAGNRAFCLLTLSASCSLVPGFTETLSCVWITYCRTRAFAAKRTVNTIFANWTICKEKPNGKLVDFTILSNYQTYVTLYVDNGYQGEINVLL